MAEVSTLSALLLIVRRGGSYTKEITWWYFTDYVPSTYPDDAILGYQRVPGPTEGLMLDAVNRLALKQILALGKQHGTKYILCLNDVDPDYHRLRAILDSAPHIGQHVERLTWHMDHYGHGLDNNMSAMIMHRFQDVRHVDFHCSSLQSPLSQLRISEHMPVEYVETLELSGCLIPSAPMLCALIAGFKRLGHLSLLDVSLLADDDSEWNIVHCIDIPAPPLHYIRILVTVTRQLDVLRSIALWLSGQAVPLSLQELDLTDSTWHHSTWSYPTLLSILQQSSGTLKALTCQGEYIH